MWALRDSFNDCPYSATFSRDRSNDQWVIVRSFSFGAYYKIRSNFCPSYDYDSLRLLVDTFFMARCFLFWILIWFNHAGHAQAVDSTLIRLEQQLAAGDVPAQSFDRSFRL